MAVAGVGLVMRFHSCAVVANWQTSFVLMDVTGQHHIDLVELIQLLETAQYL
jgi:hypothetical protein